MTCMRSRNLITALRCSLCLFSAGASLAVEGAPKKITTTEAMGAVVTKVSPEYPALAKQLKIGGSVELAVVIGENGTVEAVTPISGNPVLTKPAAEALKKWKFKPFQDGGAPTRAEAALKIHFTN